MTHHNHTHAHRGQLSSSRQIRDDKRLRITTYQDISNTPRMEDISLSSQHDPRRLQTSRQHIHRQLASPLLLFNEDSHTAHKTSKPIRGLVREEVEEGLWDEVREGGGEVAVVGEGGPQVGDGKVEVAFTAQPRYKEQTKYQQAAREEGYVGTHSGR